MICGMSRVIQRLPHSDNAAANEILQSGPEGRVARGSLGLAIDCLGQLVQRRFRAESGNRWGDRISPCPCQLTAIFRGDPSALHCEGDGS
jgi:hypothetical protein